MEGLSPSVSVVKIGDVRMFLTFCKVKDEAVRLEALTVSEKVNNKDPVSKFRVN